MMQVSIPLKSVSGGLSEPAAGETEDQETTEGSEADVRSRTNTSKGPPVASMRLVVLPVSSTEKGPDLRAQRGVGFSELLEWCDAIDLKTAIETESEG